ncbi:MAG: hypothetical protein AB1505_33585 [Candidatus Latescibacterota bacterium]
MIIAELRVPCCNTTLMGVVRGVADYYGLPASDALLYGGTGHAFLMNIHEALCPSGPYCWNPEPFVAGLRNLGLVRTDHGFFGTGSSAGERAVVEGLLRSKLEAGIPCSLLNMENQLITGYDDSGFLTTQPWAPHVDFPPAHLSFGTWAELGQEFHLSFFSFERREPATPLETVVASLEYAVDVWRRPERHTGPAYGVGPRAYDNWIAAVEQGHGASHGNWWNGTVWAECRSRAADYLRELAAEHPQAREAGAALGQEDGIIAANLGLASDKEMDPAAKVALLRQTRAAEEACIPRLETLAESLRAGC